MFSRITKTLSAIFLTSLALTACGAEATPESTGQSSSSVEGSQSLTFSFGQSVHPFFIAMEKGARDAAEELGVTLNVTSADYVIESQVKNIEDSLQQGAQAILVNPIDSKALANITQTALDADIPVISVDIDVLGAETSAFVASDNMEIGRMAAKYVSEQLGGTGRIAMIGFPNVTSTLQREQGFLEELKSHPGIELVANSGEALERSTALTAAETILQGNPDIDAIFGVNESGALGALSAATASGKNILILGVDATPDILDAIKNETAVKATIAQDPYKMGYQAVEAAVNLLEGKTQERVIPVEIELVDQSNVDNIIEREAQYEK